jgi:hypothetical protein
MKLTQAHVVPAKTVHPTLHKDNATLKEVGQVGDKNALRGDEEGAIENL